MNDVLAELGLPEAPEPLPGTVVDSHTHLDSTLESSGLSVADALALAAVVGVDRLVQVGCDAASSEWAALTASSHDQIVATVALHPNEVARHPSRVVRGLEVVARLAASGDHIRGVGETGLDYFRTREPEGQSAQRGAFAAHIAIAAGNAKTLVIHNRQAHDDVLDVLSAETTPERIVMHCFSGDAGFAKACLNRGAWLSFPGTVTFKPNHDLRAALAVTPADRVLVETDAPYLTPVPFRGRANSPYLLPHTVRFVAEVKGWDLAYACERLSANAEAAFGGPWGRP